MDMTAVDVEIRGKTRTRHAAEDSEAPTSVLTETPAVKRKKLEEKVDGESISLCLQVQLTNGDEIVTEPSETTVFGRFSSARDQCQSPSSEDNLVGASISWRFGQKLNGKVELVGLEEDNAAETGTSKDYRKNKSSVYSESMDSDYTAGEVQPSETAEYSHRSWTVTEAQLEDFFMAAEKGIRENIIECSTKYNFDFVREKPLNGRFEWVKLNI